MGERYTLTADRELLEEHFGMDATNAYKPRFNAGPTQLLPVITQESQGLSFFYWGQIPGWSKNKSLSTKLLFAEKETLDQKSSTRKALAQNRCIVPMDGYYEWKRISKKGRVAHRLLHGNNELFGAAGLWEEFEDDDGEVTHTFKIITTASNTVIASLNHRMPAVVSKEKQSVWLSGEDSPEVLSELLVDLDANKTSMYTVSPKIEDLSNDDASLIKPFAPADQFGNYSLFD